MKFLSRIKSEPWQIAAARYCVDASEKGFSFNELRNFLQEECNYSLTDLQVQFFWEEEIQKPAGRNHGRQPGGVNRGWVAPMDLVSKINDFDELKEARRASKQATIFALVAILISVMSIVLNVFITQQVKIDDGQYNNIIKLFSKTCELE